MKTRRFSALGFLALSIGLLTYFGGRAQLWSSSGKTATSNLPSLAQAASSEAESLQGAFIRIAKQVGPSVVSISTEQIERVKQFLRGHPFFGEEPFDEFFRQFYGEIPERELRRFGLGSGVIIDERGYVLTNEHVVADAEKITVTLNDGREFEGTVKGKDTRSDLAVIKIDANKLPTAILGDSGTAQVGQWVMAIGNPLGIAEIGPAAQTFGSEPTISVGVISGVNRQLPRSPRQNRDYSDLIQTDATINPGNSGGPLVNLSGEVIGVNVAIIVGPGNAYGFAIPSNKARRVMAALVEGKKVTYGWLGIQIQDITEDVAQYYGLSEKSGVLIYEVIPESPASKAGLKDGDIIKAFDGQPVAHSRQLIDHVSQTPEGRKASVEVLREGKKQVFSVEIGQRPEEIDTAGRTGESWRGLVVGGLSQENIERFRVPAGISGVIVLDVEANSPADRAGLQPGDIINEVNRVGIESLSDYRKVIAALQGPALVRTQRGYVVIKQSE
ncbi:MAG: trypsin-like peptidase domain-containing protein [Candidatus Omnitrophica bacterium]|nr:trypsin-like peptidase domain-containing protein [Candidatus Omnitrophota bacterium]